MSSSGVPTITAGTLVSGDTASWTQSFSSKNVGTSKVIIPAGSVSDGNSGNIYTVTFVNNTTGVITKTPLMVTADNLSKLVDDPDPVFTFTYLGFWEMDSTIDVDIPPTCNVTISHTNAGTYPIICSGGLDNNYTFNYVNGTLSVSYADRTLTGNAGVAGAVMSYVNNGAQTVTADGSGNYSITVPYGWTGTVTPSLNSDLFCPASQTYNNLQANRSQQNYAHTACPQFNTISKWTNSLAAANGWTVADYVRTVGDVNGDGRADLIGFGLDGVYVALALNPGPGFGTVSKWTSAFDLSHGWTVADYVRTVGDVNGDGRADLIGFGLDGVYVALALNPGPGFGTVSKWSSSLAAANGWTVASYVRTVGDVNGDGQEDLVGFGQDGVYVSLSMGNSFALPSRLTTSFDLSHGWTVKDYVRTVGDVNGDGKSDLVGFGLDGVYIATVQ
jgi:REP element-mobilizing transposase RayT